jgi:hypothetical protein
MFALTVENGCEYPCSSSRSHLPVLYAFPVLGPEVVQLARLEVYRVDASTTDRCRIRETLKLSGQGGLLKDSVRPPFGPS